MRTSPKARAGFAACILAAAALPAIGQDRPESILPPGFGEPAVRPTPRPSATATGVTPGPVATTPGEIVQPLPSDIPSPTETPTATPTIDAAALAEHELPSFARRSLASVGPTTTSEGGLPADAFGRAEGPFLETLMRRTAAPLPSRWMSILLRRLLVSELATPRGVNGADFAAERAWLLLRMGEAVGARAVVQGVDTGHYTPKLYQVAMNAMLAAGDPAGLCPLQPGAAAAAPERGWTLAGAMCASLRGEAKAAAPLLKDARRRRVASGIDLQLAQKVVGAGPNGGQAVTIEWVGVDRLTAWRFGLATATGVAIPDEMLATAGAQVRGWQAVSPFIPLAQRTAAAEWGARNGVLSSAALVDLYGAIDEANDAQAGPSAVASDLRTAFTAGDRDGRLAAIRQVWGEGARTDYARLVLTARAAGRLVPGSGIAESDRLVASMLAAGLDRTAARWMGAVDAGSDAWAMLAVADPDVSRRLTYRDLAGYSGSGDAALKQRLLFAGLAGLGRLAPDDIERAASALDVKIGSENAWTRALDRAASAGEPGTVVLLAAIGMQTPAWQGIPPEMLYRIVGALRAVGLGGEARMIAAEAIARA